MSTLGDHPLVSAGRQHRWQQVLPDGEPPATPLKGTNHLVDGIFSHGCEHLSDGREWGSRAKSEKGGHAPLQPGSGPLPLSGWALLPPLPEVSQPSFVSQCLAPRSWSTRDPLLPSLPFLGLSFPTAQASSLSRLLGKTGLCAAAQLVWGPCSGGRGRTDLPKPQAPSMPASRPWQMLLLCFPLAAPGSGTRHHSDRTVLGWLSQRAEAWTKARFLHLPAGGTAQGGASPISGSWATAKGRCPGAQAGQTDILETAPGHAS